ncbi:protein brambleberry isoform X1 [Nothobranchius furzeri]|uniref:protein brambleberry isoform X1 n=1 Tax=Nothobranchius furzeri TaxID=105023 RepID=UPI00390495B4
MMADEKLLSEAEQLELMTSVNKLQLVSISTFSTARQRGVQVFTVAIRSARLTSRHVERLIVSNQAGSVCCTTRQQLFLDQAELTINTLIYTEGQLELKDLTAASLDKLVEVTRLCRGAGGDLTEEHPGTTWSVSDNDQGTGEVVVSAECFRSMKKTEKAHKLSMVLKDSQTVQLLDFTCTCKAGKASCNHRVALLFQSAHYSQLKVQVVPPLLSCSEDGCPLSQTQNKKDHRGSAEQTVQRPSRGLS